jgi:hypothetical protein
MGKPSQVYVELQSKRKGKLGDSKFWMLGMMNGLALSVCYGSPASRKCALKIDASGTVHFLGSTFFHGSVGKFKAATKTKQKGSTTGKKSNKKASKKAKKTKKSAAVKKAKAALGEGLGNTIKLDARLDTQAANEGEIPSKKMANKVWWGGETLLQTAESSGRPTYHVKIGGRGSKLPAGQWKANNGKVSLRLESQNSLEGKNVYLEMRNQGRRDAWGVGMKKDLKLHIGYGMLGTFAKKDFVTFSANKEVRFYTQVVFSKMPSYFKKGNKLTLMKYSATNALPSKPAIGSKISVKTKSAMGVPETPRAGKMQMGTNAGSEPLVAYTATENVSIRLSSENTGALKEAFVEIRSQKSQAWRIAVYPDGNLYFSHHTTGNTGKGSKVMKVTPTGDVHIYGNAYFAAGTMKNF